MTTIDPQPTVQPPQRLSFQFSLRTLMLLFVVLASSLAVFGAWGIVVFGLTLGLAIGIQRATSFSSPSFVALTAFYLICFLAVLLMPFANVAREYSRRLACLFKVKNIARALLAYQDKNGRLPPAYIADKTGTPMYSWRVLILPQLEYYGQFKAFDFAQPWNDPKNKLLATIGLSTYRCPSERIANSPVVEPITSYVAIVGNGAAWAGEKPRELADFGNDPSHTIIVIEVANSGIVWSEPRDLLLDTLNVSDLKSPPITFASHRTGHSDFFFVYAAGAGVHVAMADGNAHFLRTDCLSSEDLRKVLEIGGCKNVAGGPHVALDEEEWQFNWPNIAALAVWLVSVGTLLTQAVRSRKASSTPQVPLAS